MHDLYVFDFLRTVSHQLKDTLEILPASDLNDAAIMRLQDFQLESRTSQGVYVLIYEGQPKYIGKANNVKERLSQHLTKLRGRKNIILDSLSYKALLLDKSMSTAANEDILIGLFRQEYAGMWNGAGFGPKDPGRERDTTKPGKFDQEHRIIEDYLINVNLDENHKVGLGHLLSAMKSQLPYVFRYEVDAENLKSEIDLKASRHTAKDLLQAVVNHLGEGWRGAVISYGMVLYKSNKNYPHGTELNPVQD
ncbi:GIY-YIG nuclease family protein [Massilia aurea]|uniref:GIY-YIG nuclease family protein n=1 Tax=Massilia aurea TaxID=373040 RepID=UPI0034625BC4